MGQGRSALSNSMMLSGAHETVTAIEHRCEALTISDIPPYRCTTSVTADRRGRAVCPAIPVRRGAVGSMMPPISEPGYLVIGTEQKPAFLVLRQGDAANSCRDFKKRSCGTQNENQEVPPNGTSGCFG